jgi:hypothetical protein
VVGREALLSDGVTVIGRLTGGSLGACESGSLRHGQAKDRIVEGLGPTRVGRQRLAGRERGYDEREDLNGEPAGPDS